MEQNQQNQQIHTKKPDNLTYVNNFIAKTNKKMLSTPKNVQQKACSSIAAILDKNKSLIKQYSSEGIPDEIPILRAFIWKLLLNYLPEDPKKWEETLNQKRAIYNNYKKFSKEKLDLEIKEKNYKSKDVLEQIIKDVYRTNTQISFFYEPTNKNLKDKKSQENFLKLFEKRKTCTFNDIDEIYYDNEENEIHADVLRRILFIYTILCPDISYHQGMNELFRILSY